MYYQATAKAAPPLPAGKTIVRSLEFSLHGLGGAPGTAGKGTGGSFGRTSVPPAVDALMSSLSLKRDNE